MASTAIERFHSRRAIKDKLAAKTRPSLLEGLPKRGFQETPVLDQERISGLLSINNLDWDRAVRSDEVDARLNQLRDIFDQERTEVIWKNCRDEALRIVITGLGLGKIASVWDKIGGNVDTIHNVRNEIYATQTESDRYDQRGEYDSVPYHKHETYISVGKQNRNGIEKGTTVDDYTGRIFTLSDRNNSQTKPVVDHVVSTKRIHDDRGRILADTDGVELANLSINLATTSATVNSAKNSRTAADFEKHLEATAMSRRNRIAILMSKSESLSGKEIKELTKLQEQETIDTKRIVEKEAATLTELKSEIDKRYYSSKKFPDYP